MSTLETVNGIARPLVTRLDDWGRYLAPFFDLAVRLGVAWIFYKSGLNKFQSWDTTVFLFEHEYAVPLLSPPVAAALATFITISPVRGKCSARGMLRLADLPDLDSF